MTMKKNILSMLIISCVLFFNYVQCELIVEVDTQLIIHKVNSTEVVDSFKLNNFKFISKYNTNDTISGDYCYARTNETFFEDCFLKKPNTTWIVVNPFDET